MRGWLLFQNPLDGDVPEAWEIHRFLEAGRKRGLDLTVVHPRHFELIVATERDWRAEYDGKKLVRPDFIIPRTGAETNYFTLAVLRHFEHQAVAAIGGFQRVQNLWQVAFELHVDNRARHLGNAANKGAGGFC